MVFVVKRPNSLEKLEILGKVAKFDVSGFPSIFAKRGKKFQRFKFIYPAVGKKGRWQLFLLRQPQEQEL